MTPELRALWIARLASRLREERRSLVSGRVSAVDGGLVEARVGEVLVGQQCEIETGEGVVRAEVIGLDGTVVKLLPWAGVAGIGVGAKVLAGRRPGGRLRAEEALGRVLDGLGEPLDGGLPVGREPGPAVRRFDRRLLGSADWLETGVGGIDVLAPLGRGARVAVIGEAGSGKTYLLRRLRERVVSEVLVIGLVGERAREAAALVEEVMSGEQRGRTTVVVATSDAPASERVAAAALATELAESWRSAGRDCLLMVDSLTRYARALREVAQVRGEPLGASGYPVTMSGSLAALLERAGAGATGSVTGLYTVLSDSERDQGAVCEEVRSLVDVQVVLRRSLADRGQFPAMDFVASMSRLSEQLQPTSKLEAARACRSALGLLDQHRDALELGYYRAGSRVALDLAVAEEESLRRALMSQHGEELWATVGGVASRLRR